MNSDMSSRDADRRHGAPTHDQLTSVDAVLADGKITPPRKLAMLTGWDKRHGNTRSTGHGRVAGAADLGFPDPAPYSPEVQRAIVELYRLHRKELPVPQDGPWFEQAGPVAGRK